MPQMTSEEIVAHAQDIKRHAIPIYKSKKAFEGLPRYDRYKECISLVVDIYRVGGPMSFDSGRTPILL